MIRSLLYVALCTRLDINNAVMTIACFYLGPPSYRFQSARSSFKDMRGTLNLGFTMFIGSTAIQCLAELDYAGEILDRKSMSGYLIKAAKAVRV